MARADLDELQLANRLGATQRSIQNWLAGKNQPNLVYRRVLDRIERRLAEKVAP